MAKQATIDTTVYSDGAKLAAAITGKIKSGSKVTRTLRQWIAEDNKDEITRAANVCKAFDDRIIKLYMKDILGKDSMSAADRKVMFKYMKEHDLDSPVALMTFRKQLDNASGGELTVKGKDLDVQSKSGTSPKSKTPEHLKIFRDFVRAFEKEANGENKTALIAAIDRYQEATKNAK